MRILVVVTVALVTAAGCASITPQGEKVRVVRNANHVKDCASLGELEARAAVGGFLLAEVGYESNQRELQNETAARGGNTLLIHGDRLGALASSQTHGEAFRCQ